MVCVCGKNTAPQLLCYMVFMFFGNSCIFMCLTFYFKQEVQESQKRTEVNKDKYKSTVTPGGVTIRAEGIKDGSADMLLFQMRTRLNGTR